LVNKYLRTRWRSGWRVTCEAVIEAIRACW
jgi:hypothetical protein